MLQRKELEPRPRQSNEARIRDRVAADLASIEPGLHLYAPNGVEFPCRTRECRRIGSIDILAEDSLFRLVVIECKAGAATVVALGQLVGYVSWARKHLAHSGRVVRGMIVANRANFLLRLALEYFDLFPVTLVLVPEH